MVGVSRDNIFSIILVCEVDHLSGDLSAGWRRIRYLLTSLEVVEALGYSEDTVQQVLEFVRQEGGQEDVDGAHPGKGEVTLTHQDGVHRFVSNVLRSHHRHQPGLNAGEHAGVDVVRADQSRGDSIISIGLQFHG